MNNAEFSTKLRTLISLEPSLEERLKGTSRPNEIIEGIMAAASRHSISVDAAELASRIEAARAHVAKGKINDDQLTGVAGGVNIDSIIDWILSAGSPIEVQRY